MWYRNWSKLIINPHSLLLNWSKVSKIGHENQQTEPFEFYRRIEADKNITF